ncbi:MAG: hypothetical protein LBF60_09685 [Treponema sp.]|nr:hypothetical protein [Treponema sp.]
MAVIPPPPPCLAQGIKHLDPPCYSVADGGLNPSDAPKDHGVTTPSQE